jgi:uracil-DNA glycosylase
VTADELPDAFASVPPAWRERLPGWSGVLQDAVVAAVRQTSGARAIAPADPFRALRLVAPDAARVVVFGQDPYPTPGQADGLAFSAERSTRPSLRRIFDVLEADRPGWRRPASGRLDTWAAQGALLLNPALTVEVGRKESHLQTGWQALTSQIVSLLCRLPEPPVFMLWGSQAQAFFDAARPAGATPCVLRTRHPSNDFGRDFMRDGSHFAATADRIDWWRFGPPSGAGFLL